MSHLKIIVEQYNNTDLLDTQGVLIPASFDDIKNKFDYDVGDRFVIVALNLPNVNIEHMDTDYDIEKSLDKLNDIAVHLENKLGKELLNTLIAYNDKLVNKLTPSPQSIINDVIKCAQRLDKHVHINHLVSLNYVFNEIDRVLEERDVNSFNQMYHLMNRLNSNDIGDIYHDYVADNINSNHDVIFSVYESDRIDTLNSDMVNTIIYDIINSVFDDLFN